MITPNQEEFHALAPNHDWIPVWQTVLADTTTVLGAYWKLAHDATYSFLLESVTGGEQIARYSVIGVNPSKVMRAKAGKTRWSDGTTEPDGEDGLRIALRHVPTVAEELCHALPKFFGGAVGIMAYDYVRSVENLPDDNPDTTGVDDILMMFADGVVVFDHAKNQFVVVAISQNNAADYERCCAVVNELSARIKSPLPPLPSESYSSHPVTSNVTKEQYEASVAKVIDYVAAGDCFQVVPSIRFETKVDAHPLTVYRALRSLNPSPYMFLIRGGDVDIIGASPELLVGLQGREARVRPIAGTRPRGATPAEDKRLAEELLADEKERAEHIMLVDLGRNDIGRVSEYGTVSVQDLMVIERYSHVMHIVTEVRGILATGYDQVDLIRSAFPAGTVSGAPKIRAMEVIDEVETTRRGYYGGAVGYFGASGALDTAITLRTIVMKDGVAYVQAGAGVVYDSIPEKEYQECCNKAAACLRAIEIAQAGL